MITFTRSEVQQVLDALEPHTPDIGLRADKAIETLRARLAQPEPEPTKLFGPNIEGILNAAGFYKQREWQGLTQEELDELIWAGDRYDVIAAAEAKLKEKNNG